MAESSSRPPAAGGFFAPLLTGRPARRWWDWPAVLLLFGIYFLAATRLQLTNWTDGLGHAANLILFGGFLGLLLGLSRFRPSFVAVLGVLFGLAAISWQLSLTYPEAAGMSQRLFDLWQRITLAWGQLVGSQPLSDSILFLVAMSVLYWTLGVSAGYLLVRHGQPWVPLGVVAVAMIVFERYQPGTPMPIYSGAVTLLILLMLGRLHYVQSAAVWREKQVRVQQGTSTVWLSVVLAASLLLAAVAWGVPSVAQGQSSPTAFTERVRSTWQSVSDRFSKAVAPLRGSAPQAVTAPRPQMPLGTTAATGEQVVLSVHASSPAVSGTYYWTTQIYLSYQDGNWSADGLHGQSIGVNQVMSGYPAWQGRQVVTLSFTPQQESGQLPFGDAPMLANRPLVGSVLPHEDPFREIMALWSEPALPAGASYDMIAWMSAPTLDQLNQSSGDYPQWIKDTYLQVPANLPDRVRTLAEGITLRSQNEYEAAQAVTQYLRDTITYSEQVSPPPEGWDPIDYFLFVSKSGFCNYYASAEVLLLREVGIPARLAVGYAQGEADGAGTTYTVRAKDSHAWPEVYFNGIGWVPFEPTVIREEPTFPTQQPTEAPTDSLSGADTSAFGQTPLAQLLGTPPAPQPPSSGGGASALQILAPLMVVLGGGLLFYARRHDHTEDESRQDKAHPRRRLPWADLPPLLRMFVHPTVSDLYERTGHLARLLGVPWESWQTPAERMAGLMSAFPEAEAPALELLEEVQRDLYSPHLADQLRARAAFRRLRSALRHGIWRRLKDRLPWTARPARGTG